MNQSKRNSLIFLILTMLLILILAAGLPGIELSQGQPFSLGQSESGAGGDSILLAGDWPIMIFRGFLALAIILLPIYIIYSLLTPERRKRLLAELVLIALVLYIAEYLRQFPRKINLNPPEQAVGGPLTLDQLPAAPIASLSAPPQWLTLVIILVISLLVVALIVGIIWFVRRRNPPQKPSWALLAQEAQNAIDSIHTGSDLKLTIVRCYQEMTRVVKEEKGIARETAMTPREFEEHLVDQGLPQKPIRELTRLFEKVRYGSISAEAQEENLALSCLTDIINACQSNGELHAIQ